LSRVSTIIGQRNTHNYSYYHKTRSGDRTRLHRAYCTIYIHNIAVTIIRVYALAVWNSYSITRAYSNNITADRLMVVFTTVVKTDGGRERRAEKKPTSDPSYIPAAIGVQHADGSCGDGGGLLCRPKRGCYRATTDAIYGRFLRRFDIINIILLYIHTRSRNAPHRCLFARWKGRTLHVNR